MKRIRFALYVFAVLFFWLPVPLRSTGDPSQGDPNPGTESPGRGQESERPLPRPARISESPGRDLARQIETVLRTRRSEESCLVSLRNRATDETSLLRIQQAIERWKLETEIEIFKVQAQWAQVHQRKHMENNAAQAVAEIARILKSKNRTALIQGHSETTKP